MLNRRAKHLASETLNAVATDIIQFGQVLDFAGIDDLNDRLADGRYPDDSEIEAIADLMALGSGPIDQDGAA